MSLLTKALMLLAFFGLVVGGIALLPSSTDYPLPSGISTAITFSYSLYSWINTYLPLDVMITIFKYSITIEGAIWIFKNFKGIFGWAARLAS